MIGAEQFLNIDLIPANPILKALAAKTEAPSRLRDIAPAGAQGFAYSVILHILNGVVQGLRPCILPHQHWAVAAGGDALRQILGGDHGVVVGENVHGVFHGMLKLPDVARPIITLEPLQGVRGDKFYHPKSGLQHNR